VDDLVRIEAIYQGKCINVVVYWKRGYIDIHEHLANDDATDHQRKFLLI